MWHTKKRKSKPVIFLLLLWNEHSKRTLPKSQSHAAGTICRKEPVPNWMFKQREMEVNIKYAVICWPLLNNSPRFCQLSGHGIGGFEDNISTLSPLWHFARNTLPNTSCLTGDTLWYLLPNYSHRLIPPTQFQGKHTGLAGSHDRKA